MKNEKVAKGRIIGLAGTCYERTLLWRGFGVNMVQMQWCLSIFFPRFLLSLRKKGFHSKIARGICSSGRQISLREMRKGLLRHVTLLGGIGFYFICRFRMFFSKLVAYDRRTVPLWEKKDHSLKDHFLTTLRQYTSFVIGICDSSWLESSYSNLPWRKQISLHKWDLWFWWCGFCE